MADQPTGMTNDNGVLITVGIVSNGDRCAMVFPTGLSGGIENNASRCLSAVTSFDAASVGSLAALLNSASYISFVSAEGMVDGTVPARLDYTPTDHPGTRTGDPLPSQVAAEMFWYGEPDDIPAGKKRIRCAKNFLPALDVAGIDGDKLVDGYAVDIADWVEGQRGGFPNIATGGGDWYRVLGAPKPRTPGVDLQRVVSAGCRGYVVTQRRRLIPR